MKKDAFLGHGYGSTCVVAITLKNKLEVATYRGFQMVHYLYLYNLNCSIYMAKCEFQNLPRANNIPRSVYGTLMTY